MAYCGGIGPLFKRLMGGTGMAPGRGESSSIGPDSGIQVVSFNWRQETKWSNHVVGMKRNNCKMSH